jgi:hypothetical protein
MCTTGPLGRPWPASRIPNLKAVSVKTNHSPIIRANQAHPVSRCYRESASTAEVSEAGTVPQLNRAVTRKGAICDPVSNALSNCNRNHTQITLQIDLSDQSALRYGDHR